ncbi:MAG: CPBP family intramembrane metalloprotease [Spirochaetaceae bacterium]|nr:CPBP family intramembrane metalloprotease [Spirochaetaceae bacterium]
MQKIKLLFLCVGMEILLIVFVAIANFKPAPVLYFVFYNLGYGVLSSCLLVLYLLRKEKASLASIGIKRLGARQFVVLGAYIVFSVGGQLIPKLFAGEQIPWQLLPIGIVPLIMTTFFEEFVFRGFVQGRIERTFGLIPAIIISGLMFSLYHLGYPGFRTMGDIFLLFAVGSGFAIAYKLSDNNLFVSYFVNLPNAFITYILKNKQFPSMNFSSTIAAFITVILISVIFYVVHKKNKLRFGEK